MLVAAHLQSQVVLGADARQYCQLLAAQTRDASARAGNQPDLLGPYLLAPRAQVISPRVCLAGRCSSVTLSLPVPGINAASPPGPRCADGGFHGLVASEPVGQTDRNTNKRGHHDHHSDDAANAPAISGGGGAACRFFKQQGA